VKAKTHENDANQQTATNRYLSLWLDSRPTYFDIAFGQTEHSFEVVGSDLALCQLLLHERWNESIAARPECIQGMKTYALSGMQVIVATISMRSGRKYGKNCHDSDQKSKDRCPLKFRVHFHGNFRSPMKYGKISR
jgi:hypothetical protein